MARIGSLIVEIFARTSGLDSGLSQSQRKIASFGKIVNRLGGIIAAAFSVSKIVEFTKEIANLGGEAQGVEAAFKRIGGQLYLQDLKEATRNTVKDLELMKKTVQASNFGIPIQNLSKLFEFASRRAQETGESVEYLTNSIVTGIGRKSPLILDNLGISAVRLREELKGVGTASASVGDIAEVVGKIATEELANMGAAVVTTKDKIESVRSSWINFKTALGKKLIERELANEITFFNKLLDEWTDKLDPLAARHKELADIVGEAKKNHKDETQALTEYLNTLNKVLAVNSEYRSELQKVDKYNPLAIGAKRGQQARLQEEYNKKIRELGTAYKFVSENIDPTLYKTLQQFFVEGTRDIDPEKIQAYVNELNGITQASKPVIENLKAMEDRLQSLKDERMLIPAENVNQIGILNDQIKQLETNITTLKNQIGGPNVPEGFGLDFSDMEIDDLTIDSWDEFDEKINDIIGSTEQLKASLGDLGEKYRIVTELERKMMDITEQGMNTLMKQTTQSEQGLEGLADAFANAARTIVKSLIAEGVAHVVKDAMKKFGIAGIAVGTAAGTAAAAVFETVVPKFATGGIVPGSQMTGDNVIARLNSGEMVLNRGQQGKLFNMLQSGGNSSNVQFMIKGRDLYGVLNEYNKQLDITG